MGHARVYTISDALHRTQAALARRTSTGNPPRPESPIGANGIPEPLLLLHPMGWDAFGLPAENAARDRAAASPQAWTLANCASMGEQMKALDVVFTNNLLEDKYTTCTPAYYVHTQRLFLRLMDKGLAYRATAAVHWDPVDGTVLANEQVDADGRSWRSGALVERRVLDQWFFRTTAFADRLLDDMDKEPYASGWRSDILTQQRNWIGRSKGHLVRLADDIEAFSTRADTLPGATFVAVHEDHPTAVTEVPHPLFGAERMLPVLRAPYVLDGYGTGAVIGVPGLDERDRAFAEEQGLPIIEPEDFPLLDDIPDTVATPSTEYRLRDWLVSRQRFWGTPIPVIHCDDCGAVPVPEADLPVLLPGEDDYSPRGLAAVPGWATDGVHCPSCGSAARRETDTMDTFVDSSFYYRVFSASMDGTDPLDDPQPPVDVYIGGIEHAILHLLYARFIHLALGHDALPAPFLRLLAQGMVNAPAYKTAAGKYVAPADVDRDALVVRATGEPVLVSADKMSKSKLNGIDPFEIIDELGADTTRLFVLFKAPPERDLDWDDRAVAGPARWLERLERMDVADAGADAQLDAQLNAAVEYVTDVMLRTFTFNTAIARLMKVSNAMAGTRVSPANMRTFLVLLAPFAPTAADRLWTQYALGDAGVHAQPWPEYNEAISAGDDADALRTVIVQIKGKVRARVADVPASLTGDALAEHILADPAVQKAIPSGKDVTRVVQPPKNPNLVSLVIK